MTLLRMDVSRRKLKLLVDFGLGLSLLYLSVWVYEFGNFLSLSLSGAEVSISYGILLPIGTSAMTASAAITPLAKLSQVAMCSFFPLVALYGTRRLGLIGSQAISVCVLSVFLGTFYWEALGLLSFVSYATHLAGFVTLAAVLELVIFSALSLLSRHAV